MYHKAVFCQPLLEKLVVCPLEYHILDVANCICDNLFIYTQHFLYIDS